MNVNKNCLNEYDADLAGNHTLVSGAGNRMTKGGNPYIGDNSDLGFNLFSWNKGKGGEVPDYTATLDIPKGNGHGLGWFAVNWKTIAIVAGSAAILAAIIAIVKKVGNVQSIKARYNKVVRTMLRMQKDFTMNNEGLDMGSVLPGIGSRVNDWMQRVLHRNKKGKTKAFIGLKPFCEMYKNDVKLDYEAAVSAFNKIKLASDSQKSNESMSGFKSFREAFSSSLNEESGASATIATMNPSQFTVKSGQFIAKIDGETRAVDVTKESTREICYSIINNFADKYVNIEEVMKKIGIDTKSLADVDRSSCGKLAQVIKKYSEVNDKIVTKQYKRVYDAYTKMLNHYLKIGRGIIDNFSKFTVAKDEKRSNLLIASKEKLAAMWDSQESLYKDNFSHVMEEIVSDKNYVAYLNFIVERVIPLLKTGIAGDADYVLDVMPKEGEYYVVRQTQQIPYPNDVENKGNSAIARIVSFSREKKEITFTLRGLIKSDVTYYEDGTADLNDYSNDTIDTGAYDRNENITLEFGKWLSMDPRQILDFPAGKIGDEDIKHDEDQGDGVVLYRRETEKPDPSNPSGMNTFIEYILNSSPNVECEGGYKFSVPNLNEDGEGTDSSTDKADSSTTVDADKTVNNNEDDAGRKKEFNYVIYVSYPKDGSIDKPTRAEAITTGEKFTEKALDDVVAAKQNNISDFKKVDDEEEMKSVIDKIKNLKSNEVTVNTVNEVPSVIAGNANKNDSNNAHVSEDAYKKIDELSQRISKSAVRNVDPGLNSGKFFYGKWIFSGDEAGSGLKKKAEDIYFSKDFNIEFNAESKNSGNYFTVAFNDIVIEDSEKNMGRFKVAFVDKANYGEYNPMKPSTSGLSQMKLYVTIGMDISTYNTMIDSFSPEKIASAIKNVMKIYSEKNKRSILMKDNGNDDNSHVNSSVEVSYDVENSIHESNRSTVRIKRCMSNVDKNSYVISESFYDDGNMKMSILESSARAIAASIRNYDDACILVKSDVNINMFACNESCEYCVRSDFGYTPSQSTPLYENLVIVRFDNDGKTSSILKLGKKRIG